MYLFKCILFFSVSVSVSEGRKWSRETKSLNNDFVKEALSNVVSASDFRVKMVH